LPRLGSSTPTLLRLYARPERD
jgi:hypothetical protein